MAIEWSTIAFAVYLGLTVILVILLGIKAHLDKKKDQDDASDNEHSADIKTRETQGVQNEDTHIENKEHEVTQKKKKKSYISTVWSMKSVYGTVLVHLYDTSTDIGVIVAWATLTYNELVHNNPVSPDVHMLPFLIPACVLVFLHRIVFMVYYYTFLHDTDYFAGCDMIWIATDTYILKIAYESFQEGYTEPCVMQKNLQLWESVFESMPQLVLQSVFLIKTNQSLSNNADMVLIFLSIAASILSVVTKYIWYDNNWVNSRAQSLHFKYKKCTFPCCISYSYLARLLWRFSELMLRFIIFSLIWSVLGGIYLVIYLITNWTFYYLLEIYTKATWITLKLATINRNGSKTTEDDKQKTTNVDDVDKNSESDEYIDESLGLIAIVVLQSIIGIPLRHHFLMNAIRFIDNTVALSVVAVISLFPKQGIECESDIFCNNTHNKYASNNGYIMVLLVLGAIMLILELVLYLIMYTQGILKRKIEHKNYSIEDVKEDNGLTKDEKLLRLYHPMFLKRARQRQNELEMAQRDLDEAAADNEAGFGKGLEFGDVAFNPMASGVPLPLRAKQQGPDARAMLRQTSVCNMTLF